MGTGVPEDWASRVSDEGNSFDNTKMPYRTENDTPPRTPEYYRSRRKYDDDDLPARELFPAEMPPSYDEDEGNGMPTGTDIPEGTETEFPPQYEEENGLAEYEDIQYLEPDTDVYQTFRPIGISTPARSESLQPTTRHTPNYPSRMEYSGYPELAMEDIEEYPATNPNTWGMTPYGIETDLPEGPENSMGSFDDDYQDETYETPAATLSRSLPVIQSDYSPHVEFREWHSNIFDYGPSPGLDQDPSSEMPSMRSQPPTRQLRARFRRVQWPPRRFPRAGRPWQRRFSQPGWRGRSRPRRFPHPRWAGRSRPRRFPHPGGAGRSRPQRFPRSGWAGRSRPQRFQHPGRAGRSRPQVYLVPAMVIVPGPNGNPQPGWMVVERPPRFPQRGWAGRSRPRRFPHPGWAGRSRQRRFPWRGGNGITSPVRSPRPVATVITSPVRSPRPGATVITSPVRSPRPGATVITSPVGSRQPLPYQSPKPQRLPWPPVHTMPKPVRKPWNKLFD